MSPVFPPLHCQIPVIVIDLHTTVWVFLLLIPHFDRIEWKNHKPMKFTLRFFDTLFYEDANRARKKGCTH